MRRSRRKKPKSITLYYCNVNGIKSKQTSLKQIIEQIEPKIVVFCETKLPSDSILKNLLPGYAVNGRPTKGGQSGIAIAVKGQTFLSVLDVTDTKHKDIVVTRIQLNHWCAARVILGYAPQETEKVEVREQFFTELEIEITRCKSEGDIPILVGDMNAKLEKLSNEVNAVTPNGKLLLEMINNHELNVLNFDEKCSGQWTHVIRTTGAASVLDYVAVSKDILEQVKDVIIDEKCTLCPFGVKKKKGNLMPQYSDHNAIVVRFEIALNNKKEHKQESWRMSDKGLEMFNQITSGSDFPTEVEGENGEEKDSTGIPKIN